MIAELARSALKIGLDSFAAFAGRFRVDEPIHARGAMSVETARPERLVATWRFDISIV